MSFEQFFQARFVSYAKEVKDGLSHSSVNKYIKTKEDGSLVWVEDGQEVEINFSEFAKFLLARRHETLKGKIREELPGMPVRISFNPNKSKPVEVDRARAVIVNAIISNGMMAKVGASKIAIKTMFAKALADGGLTYNVGGAKIYDEVDHTGGKSTDDTIYEVTKEEMADTQVWTIRVYDKAQGLKGRPLYEITMEYDPSLVRDSGMSM